MWASLNRLILLLAILLPLAGPAAGQPLPLARADEEELPGHPAGPDSGVDLDLLQRLQRETAEIRGIAPERAIPVNVVNQADLAAFVKSHAATDTPEAAERARNSNGWRLLVLLGLVKASQDPGAIGEEVVTQNVAGLYFPNLKAMLIITPGRVDSFGPFQQVTFVHEFTHALQDQRYNLSTVFGGDPGADGANEDQAQAIRALVEGDAQLSASLWTQAHLTAEDFRRAAAAQAPGAGSGDEEEDEDEDEDEDEEDGRPSLPNFIRLSQAFTYGDGQRFVTTAYEQAGGYSGVDAAYADPPASTEQVMHPEKYWAHEAPLDVRLPDVAGALGGDWHELASGVLGELDLLQVLSEHVSPAAARTAAAGWGGGRWLLVEQDGRAAAVLKSAWDTERDAREFYDVYAHGLLTRFPDAQLAAASPSREALTDATAATELRIRGSEVLAVISFDRPSAEALAAASGF